MEKGHLRCDANVSIGTSESDLTGTRTEVKNMNSFRSVERALQFEIERQIGVLKSGGAVEQATLLWNEKEERCEVMRTKEDSHDYRYFPDPDLLPIRVSTDQIGQIKSELVELPALRAARFVAQYGLREYDASVLTGSRDLADYFEMVMLNFDNGRTAANWIQTELLGLLSAENLSITDCRVTPKALADLLTRIDKNEISTSAGKFVLNDMLQSGKAAATVIKEKNLAQVSDESALTKVVDEILAAFPENVTTYRAGKTGLLDFFVGKVMRQTRGSANPNVVRDLLKARLDA
jgi:aspartyl-tRNA(Asn)/glutamyl-tRNA(Gln) amidotransferase subunit B